MTKQYDVCRNLNATSRRRVPFVVVLQADLLSDFITVVVAPVMAEIPATKIRRLNPTLQIEGKHYRVSTAELASVLRKELGEIITNVESQHREFVDAIDLLFTGI